MEEEGQLAIGPPPIVVLPDQLAGNHQIWWIQLHRSNITNCLGTSWQSWIQQDRHAVEPLIPQGIPGRSPVRRASQGLQTQFKVEWHADCTINTVRVQGNHNAEDFSC